MHRVTAALANGAMKPTTGALAAAGAGRRRGMPAMCTGKAGAPYAGLNCGPGVYFCDDCTAEMLATEVEIP